MTDPERNVEYAKGAEEALSTLQEEIAEWLEEANSEGQKEALENVLGHIEAMRREYSRRGLEAEANKHSSSPTES